MNLLSFCNCLFILSTLCLYCIYLLFSDGDPSKKKNFKHLDTYHQNKSWQCCNLMFFRFGVIATVGWLGSGNRTHLVGVRKRSCFGFRFSFFVPKNMAENLLGVSLKISNCLNAIVFHSDLNSVYPCWSWNYKDFLPPVERTVASLPPKRSTWPRRLFLLTCGNGRVPHFQIAVYPLENIDKWKWNPTPLVWACFCDFQPQLQNERRPIGTGCKTLWRAEVSVMDVFFGGRFGADRLDGVEHQSGR